jgi:adenylate cyclase
LIGASAPSLHDYYKTPYGERRQLTLIGKAESTQGVRMDGFEIHANAIQTILDRRFVYRSKDQWGLVPALMVGMGLLGTVLLMQTWNRSLLIEVFRWALIVGIGAVAFGLFWWSRYWLDIVPLYSLVAAQYSAAVSYQRYLEGQKRREVQAMFGRYVSQRVVEQLVKNPEMANPSGRKERLTMFFSDVRGFTSMSEKMEPQEVQQLLSEYFTEMTRILFKHGGTLDKFMGDAVMAFFGNPEPQPDHALRAVLMALEMQEAVAQLNQKWAAGGRRTIGVGMGLDTGDVTVGNLGSKDFLDYTVIGDHVNLACRLEQNAKAGEIIITQATYDEVKTAVEVEAMEPMRVKGKSEPIPIYRVLRRLPAGSA